MLKELIIRNKESGDEILKRLLSKGVDPEEILEKNDFERNAESGEFEHDDLEYEIRDRALERSPLSRSMSGRW